MAKELTPFGIATLEDRYFLPGETLPIHLYTRVAEAYKEDDAHRDRLIQYMEDQWWTPSTPILSNGGTNRGLPISCFLNRVQDNMEGIIDNFVENFWLSAKGGGTGVYYGDVREIGSKIKDNGKTSGVIPFIHMMDGMTSAINQGSLRRASSAVYIDVTHPEIEEFLEIRKPSGDFSRKALNLHHAVVIPNSFMEAVREDEDYELISPKIGPTGVFLNARSIWQKILEIRLATGEPYILFSDNANGENRSAVYKKMNLKVTTSNLCAEIMLHVGEDYNERERTAVCCLSSVNAATYNEWSKEEILTQFIDDIAVFLDNVLEDFINRAPESMRNAVYAAIQERSIGIGMMGWHTFLQKMSIPFDGVMAKVWNKKIWTQITEAGAIANLKWAKIKGSCPDAKAAGLQMRWANMFAVAPTASVSILCGGGSAGIEPIPANIYTHKTLSGSFEIKNPELDLVLRETLTDEQYEAAWETISKPENKGSVQNVEGLDDHQKEVFKTAEEIDQRALIEQAADRQACGIDQGQSLNIFLPSNVDKWDLHMIHWTAWEQGVKALYYLRSTSEQRVSFDPDKYEVCLACQ